MAEVRPLKGVVYNTEKIKDISKVIAPPYDVISEKERDLYYELHPFNIIRLILNRPENGDSSPEDRIKRAADYFQRWLKEGILVQDNSPAIYYLETDYWLDNSDIRTRRGFIARIKIEEYEKGIIRPHEKTFSKTVSDRLRLMEATHANLSPIFSFFSDPGFGIIEELTKGLPQEPHIACKDWDGFPQRIWKITDPSKINALRNFMIEKKIFIADGHHRYQTALLFRNKIRERFPDLPSDSPINYVLMYFCPLESGNLTILPCHRFLMVSEGFQYMKFIKKLEKEFYVKEISFNDAYEKGKAFNKLMEYIDKEANFPGTTFGVYHRSVPSFFLIKIEQNVAHHRLGNQHPKELIDLDVFLIKEIIFKSIIGIKETLLDSPERVLYFSRANDLLDRATKDEKRIAFFINPTRIEQVKAVSEAGLIMPRKSTFFYPKLASGLVINLLS